jgi:hypothetical protein
MRLSRRGLLGAGAALVGSCGFDARGAFIPVASPNSLLAGANAFNVPGDCERMDVEGLDGQTMGGILITFAFAVPSNTSGQTLYYMLCPNNLETNQASTGSETFSRLVIASFANNAAADVIRGSCTLTRTKTGANRVGTSSVTLDSGPTKNVTWTWSDTTTVINWFRIKARKADGTRWIANTILQNIPGGPPNSNYAWNSVGNP